MDDRREWNPEEDWPRRARGHRAAVARMLEDASNVVPMHGRRFQDMRTKFAGVADAVGWYAEGDRVGLLEGVHAPPVDATGDKFIDQSLRDEFVKLATTPWQTLRIRRLLTRARDNRHAAKACRESAAKGGEHAAMFAGAAEDHDRLADVLERWADAFHAAATAPPPSAA
ncbi:MAG: hypothetical protein KIS96_11395 [Bauldia sp.]|nr:hypothetical protein [Bauldia sp.]